MKMSLNWDITNCNNWNDLKSDKEWGITNALIWGTMYVDMGEITQENCVEFYARMKAIEVTFGAICSSPDGDYFITIEDVKKRIGLTSNVATKTAGQFFKKLKEHVKQELASA